MYQDTEYRNDTTQCLLFAYWPMMYQDTEYRNDTTN